MFDLTGVPQFVADDAVAVVDTFVHALETGTAGLAETVDPGAVRASLAEMLAAYRTDLPNAVWDTLDGTVSALLASVVARVDDPVVAGDLFARLAAFDPGRTPVPSTTATRRRQAANRRALVDLIHTASVAAHAVTTTRRQLDSREEADAVRRHALAGLDQVRAVAGETASGDPVFVAMGILRAAVIRDLRTRSAGLPALRTVRTGPLTSAFALAWRLYGNAARGDEIMARNPRFTHPGKLPPQSSLDVLDG